MKKWILALLIAAFVIVILCGAISALATLASNHEIAAAIIFFGLITVGFAAIIRRGL